jgi:hypothetical protein
VGGKAAAAVFEVRPMEKARGWRGGGEAVGSGGIQVLAIWMDAGNRCELDGDVTS